MNFELHQIVVVVLCVLIVLGLHNCFRAFLVLRYHYRMYRHRKANAEVDRIILAALERGTPKEVVLPKRLGKWLKPPRR